MAPDPHPFSCSSEYDVRPSAVDVLEERLEWHDCMSALSAKLEKEKFDLLLRIKDLETANTIRAIQADSDMKRLREEAIRDEDLAEARHAHQIQLVKVSCAQEVDSLRTSGSRNREAWAEALDSATEDQAGTKLACFIAGVLSSASAFAAGYGLLELLA